MRENEKLSKIQNRDKKKAYIPIKMPPTREGFAQLCKMMNLKISPTKILDALLFIRGPQMEDSNPDEFDFDKVVQWFLINIKTMKHLDLSKVDPDWIQE